MGDQQLEYLEFQADEVHYLIPLSWVDRISERTKKKGRTVLIDFGGLTSPGRVGTQQEYLILADEEKAGFLADRVLGMRTLDRRAFISLREPALKMRPTGIWRQPFCFRKSRRVRCWPMC